MSFHVIRPEDAVWEDRPNQDGQLRRLLDVTSAGELTQSRARSRRRLQRRIRTRRRSRHVRLRCRP